MPGLLDHPNELLECIVHYIHRRKETALGLIQCSRSLHAVCVHTAYSRVVVEIDYTKVERLPLLLHTLQEQSRLADSIRDFKATWLSGASEEDLSALDQVLSKLEGLVYLDLHELHYGERPPDTQLRPTFQHTHKFCHLRKASLECAGFTSYDIWKLMAILSLETLFALHVSHHYWPDPCKVSNKAPSGTPVDIRLRGSGLPLHVLRAILDSGSNVVRLQCSGPFEGSAVLTLSVPDS